MEPETSHASSSTDSSSPPSSSVIEVQVPLPFPDFHSLPIRAGNKHYGYRMMLYCRTGFHLVILPDGTVKGVDAEFDKYGVFEFSSAGSVAEVRIKAVETNLYLAMNKKGRLYGESNKDEEGTIFIESVIGQYNAYLSRKFAHFGWYVGIKKSGKHKPAHMTRWGQKSIQFLPRRIDS